jgi:hypothetical protein
LADLLTERGARPPAPARLRASPVLE